LEVEFLLGYISQLIGPTLPTAKSRPSCERN